VINACKVAMDAAALDFTVAASYQVAVQPALAAAKATLDANVRGLTNSGSSVYAAGYSPGFATSGGAGIKYMVDLPGGGGVPAIATYQRVNDTAYNYMALVMCPAPAGCSPFGVMPSQTEYLSSWYYKDDINPDIWVMAEAQGTMQNTYLDIYYSAGGGDGGYFGGSSIGSSDRMYAVGVSKPFEGSVGPAAEGGTTRNGNCCATPIYNAQGIRYPKLTVVDTYRARIAGIREWEDADDLPVDTLALEWGADAYKFRH